MEHEQAFVKAFIAPANRARFIHFLPDPKRRQEVLRRLDHALPYLRDLAEVLSSEQDYPAELEKLLKAKGAGPTCHLMASGMKEDGRTLPLKEALMRVCMQEFGAVISCIPGRLAYYRPESPGPGILFSRTRG